MEFREKIAYVILTQFISTVKSTTEHYCEFQTCQAWEYCCSDNICCSNYDNIYNVVIMTFIFLILLFLCCCIYFICRCASRLMQSTLSNYRSLPRDRSSSTTHLAIPSDLDYENIYSDPPPPYSEVVQMRT